MSFVRGFPAACVPVNGESSVLEPGPQIISSSGKAVAEANSLSLPSCYEGGKAKTRKTP